MMQNLRIFFIFWIIIAVVILAARFNNSSAQNETSIFPPDSRPYNKTYAQWTVDWWTYLITIPKETSPAGDNSGALCGLNQNNSNVWFLVGTFGGAAERKCTIPQHRSIIFPIINNECSVLEFPTLKTESELTSCAKQPMDKVVLHLSIDGQEIQNLSSYRVTSPIFNVIFPSNNVFGVEGGPTQAVSDGYFVMLKPFSPGNHIIKFSGIRPDVNIMSSPDVLNSQLFSNEVTYNLHIG
jgi:hypothetical protein